MKPQAILEAIAALPEAERGALLARLREIYGDAAPRPAPLRQLALAQDEWSGPADCLVIFDGGSQGNPGPAYGSYAISQAGGPARVTRLSFEAPLTNNEAEYRTLLAALRDLRQQLADRASLISLEVRGDSQLILEQVAGRWKAKDDRLRELRDDARRELAGFKRHRLVHQARADTVKVLGH